MKNLIGILFVLLRFYCGYKIFVWLFERNYYKNNLPITEIEPILVFIIFDIWVMMSIREINKDY